MRFLLLFSVLALAACVHAPDPAPPPKKVAPVDGVKAQLTALYAAVAKGETERLATLFTDDALIFGLGPSDTYNLRDVFLARLAQSLVPLGLAGDALALAESRPVVGVAEGGQSAWLYDLPRVELKHKAGGASQWLPRVTAHAVFVDDAWKFDALHVSLGVADAVVFAPDAAKKLLPPTDVSNHHARDTEQVLGLTRRLLEDFGVKIDRTSEREEFVQIGSSPAEVFEQGKTFKDLVRPQLSAIRKGGYSWKLDGNLRTGLGPGGKSGWAAGNVVLRIGTGKKQQVLPPFRTLWLFAEEQGVWNLVGEHQSLAVKEDMREPSTDAEVKAWRDARAPKRDTKPAPTANSSTNSNSSDAGVSEPGIGVW